MKHYLTKKNTRIQMCCRKTTMASLHTTRHCLLDQSICERPHSTYRTFQQTSQTLTTLPSRNQALQVHNTSATLNSSTNNCLDLEIYVDADWAGCPTTRKSTSGFNIKLLNATIAFGSRTQATVAFSPTKSDLYAICTGVNEGLHQRSFLLSSWKPAYALQSTYAFAPTLQQARA